MVNTELAVSAWRVKNKEDVTWTVKESLPTYPNTPYDKVEPLYTIEEVHKVLHPKILMTRKELDEFKRAYESSTNVYQLLEYISGFPGSRLYKKLFGDKQQGNSYQLLFARLFIDFNPKKPSLSIEIVKDKKWFVQSKGKSEDNEYLYLSFRKNSLTGSFERFNFAEPFETKDGAEEWKNPLTEVVKKEID